MTEKQIAIIKIIFVIIITFVAYGVIKNLAKAPRVDDINKVFNKLNKENESLKDVIKKKQDSIKKILKCKNDSIKKSLKK